MHKFMALFDMFLFITGDFYVCVFLKKTYYFLLLFLTQFSATMSSFKGMYNLLQRTSFQSTRANTRAL